MTTTAPLAFTVTAVLLAVTPGQDTVTLPRTVLGGLGLKVAFGTGARR